MQSFIWSPSRSALRRGVWLLGCGVKYGGLGFGLGFRVLEFRVQFCRLCLSSSTFEACLEQSGLLRLL